MTDIVADFTNRTIFENGDLATGTSDDQNKRLLLLSEKGSVKEFPATCVGAASFLESEDQDGLIREIRAQFTADGMTVRSIKIDSGKLKIDAGY